MGADRHNGILMSLLLIVAEIKQYPLVQRQPPEVFYKNIGIKKRCSEISQDSQGSTFVRDSGTGVYF